MKNVRFMFAVLVLFLLGAWRLSAAEQAPPAVDIERIDAHVHILKVDPAYRDMLVRLSVRVLNICVVDRQESDPSFTEVEPQHRCAQELFRLTGGRAAWCSTFDPTDWEQPGFAKKTIAEVQETFRQEAVAVKIYKTIGMVFKSHDGQYLMPDNPVFSPIFAAIAADNKTVYAHIAEPDACWLPLDPNKPSYDYYKNNPQWHMYAHPERPAKATILEARDRMLKNNPGVRFVGCHLGSMEDDVDAIAKRLDLYPNFAVDTAARIGNLMYQDQEKVRAFLLKYQDRVLYGTDLALLKRDDPAKVIPQMEETYARDWKYLATDESVTCEKRTVRGLALPKPVLKKLFYSNAVKWVPGVVAEKQPASGPPATF